MNAGIKSAEIEGKHDAPSFSIHFPQPQPPPQPGFLRRFAARTANSTTVIKITAKAAMDCQFSFINRGEERFKPLI